MNEFGTKVVLVEGKRRGKILQRAVAVAIGFDYQHGCDNNNNHSFLFDDDDGGRKGDVF
jgi:hypothetical protein